MPDRSLSAPALSATGTRRALALPVAPALDARQRAPQPQHEAVPIRAVPRAALDALVGRLAAEGLRRVG